jgi:predicted DNA-binding transcriptional regulator AlpA
MTHMVTLPDTSFIRQSQLFGDRGKGTLGLIPFSSATLWRKVGSGKFLVPVKLSTGVTAWKVEDVRAWIEARK